MQSVQSDSVLSTVAATAIHFEPLLDSKAAASLLGIHRKTLEKYAREGRVPAHRFGNKFLRFRASELDEWVRSTLNSASQSVRVN